MGILGDIWDGIRDLPYLIVDLFVGAINMVIAALAAIGEGALMLLPNFPSAPETPPQVIAIITWLMPIGPMMSAIGALLTAWMVFLGVAVIMRWAKAL